MKQIFFVIMVLIMSCTSAYAQELRVATEEFPPFNYLENNEVKGISTEVVKAVLAKVGIQAEIKIYPWARLYRMATEEANVLAFSMGRMPDREAHFHWIGPIAPPIRAALFKLKTRTDMTINSLEDAKRYEIGVVRDDGGHRILLAQGFEQEKNLFPVTQGEQNIHKLLAGRIDLFFSDNMFVLTKTKALGLPLDRLEEAFVFMEIENYMVLSKQTPASLVERLRQAFEQMKAKGTIEAIAQKYLQALQ